MLETLEDVYAIHNCATSWREVDEETALACDAIAARALEEDPENESALWLYTQEDFLARVGRKRPPIPPPTIAQRIDKIERILSLYVEDRVHPLDIPSLETIVIDHTAVLDAMIDAFRRAPAGRARHAFIEALGGTLVDHERVARLLADELSSENDIDDICMAFHYGLKKRGKCARDRIANLAARLVAEMREGDDDWRHLWPIRAARTLGARLVFGDIPDWKRNKIAAA